MADTPLAPLTKEAPPSPAKLFVFGVLRGYCAAHAGIPLADLPDELTATFGAVEVHVTLTTWLVTTRKGQ